MTVTFTNISPVIRRPVNFVNDEKIGFVNGDAVGHPFRGNQWRVVASGIPERPYATKDHKGDVIATWKTKAEAHDDVAERFMNNARSARKIGDEDLAVQHFGKAEEHWLNSARAAGWDDRAEKKEAKRKKGLPPAGLAMSPPPKEPQIVFDKPPAKVHGAYKVSMIT